MVDHKGGRGAALVLVRHHSEALTRAQHTVDGVNPGEDRRRLALTADLPEGRPTSPHGLRARLTLVD